MLIHLSFPERHLPCTFVSIVLLDSGLSFSGCDESYSQRLLWLSMHPCRFGRVLQRFRGYDDQCHGSGSRPGRNRRWADAFLDATRCSESEIFSPRAALWSLGFCRMLMMTKRPLLKWKSTFPRHRVGSRIGASFSPGRSRKRSSAA